MLPAWIPKHCSLHDTTTYLTYAHKRITYVLFRIKCYFSVFITHTYAITVLCFESTVFSAVIMDGIRQRINWIRIKDVLSLVCLFFIQFVMNTMSQLFPYTCFFLKATRLFTSRLLGTQFCLYFVFMTFLWWHQATAMTLWCYFVLLKHKLLSYLK